MAPENIQLGSNENSEFPTQIKETIEHIASNPDAVLAMIAEAKELGDSLKDIPAQIQLLSRCTLAKSFIVSGQNGKKDFQIKAFEDAWNYLTKEDETAETVQ